MPQLGGAGISVCVQLVASYCQLVGWRSVHGLFCRACTCMACSSIRCMDAAAAQSWVPVGARAGCLCKGRVCLQLCSLLLAPSVLCVIRVSPVGGVTCVTKRKGGRWQLLPYVAIAGYWC